MVKFLFGCSHRNLSRVWTVPIKIGRGWVTFKKRSYKVCYDCGKEFEYSWDEMRIVTGKEQKSKAREQVA